MSKMVYTDPVPHPTTIHWEAIKGVMAFVLVNATGCTTERAQEALMRQLTAASNDPVTMETIIDRLLAAQLDIMESE